VFQQGSFPYGQEKNIVATLALGLQGCGPREEAQK